MDYALRPAATADREWLRQTKARCLRNYVVRIFGSWDEDFQRARFDATFELAENQIISLAGHDAGYLTAKFEPGETQLFNLMIAPEFQGRGLGTAVLRDFLAAAQASRVPVRLQVMKVNPARRLYERLGFTVIEETTTHFRMLWRPAL